MLRIRFPYEPRLVELVKTLPNRRWNPVDKLWTVPEGDVVPLVELLEPLGFRFDESTLRRYTEVCGRERPTPSRPPDDWTVGRLNAQAHAALAAAFPVSVWLVGEIAGFKRTGGKRFVSFKLVERGPDARPIAEVNAIVFDEALRGLERSIAAAGSPFTLGDEIEVRLEVRVDLYEGWGQYRVVVEGIDPGYTLGEAARRREEIVRKLAEEGILERNRALPFPALPLRVGLVTSLDSDAYNDVLQTLRESGFAFRVTAHGARVQGRQTEPSVLNALDWFAARADAFDVVLICRGGGSRTDLAWFDTESLGRAVAGFPLPVVVGIGHEQDFSVLDHVGTRAKTPTAAAALLVESTAAALEAVERAGVAIASGARSTLADAAGDTSRRIERLARAARTHLATADLSIARARRDLPRAARRLIDRHRESLAGQARVLVQGARRDLAAERRRIELLSGAIRPRASRSVALERERVDARGRRLGLVDPRRVIERGYAILRDAAGRVIARARSAPPGSALVAELREGRLKLRSEGPEGTDDRPEER